MTPCSRGFGKTSELHPGCHVFYGDFTPVVGEELRAYEAEKEARQQGRTVEHRDEEVELAARELALT